MVTSRKYPRVKASAASAGWAESAKDRRIRELEEQVQALSAALKAQREAVRA